ncbi:MAG TPA: hypothetical protein VFC09_11680 [Candidatus Dormibacteraeota bacterium]|nr:hypothetical protein [Candidatus Dormibacteraeota bacterium]
MRRMGRAHLRTIGAISGVAACAGAGVAVAASPKPSGAPLNPPVVQARATAAATPAPPCDATGDPMVAQALDAFRAASSPAERRVALRGLTADQRQQVTALLRQCASGSQVAEPLPTVQPDVVDAAPTAMPITNSYVS